MSAPLSYPASPGAAPLTGRDASDPALLPPETPLAMAEQDFSAPRKPRRAPAAAGGWVPRAAVFLGAALVTLAFAYDLHGVLAIGQTTPLQWVFLVLSTCAFGWVSLGSLSAAMGFLPLFAGEKADNIEIPPAEGPPLSTRTALLFPVYHEDVARIAGTITTIAEELSALGHAPAFDVFILSDTRGHKEGTKEEAAYASLIRRLQGTMAVYYRRRSENTGRKAGNIKDWVERFGAGYAHFVILDGDSLMSGETLVRLARAMENAPAAGLIQTVPRLTGGTTLLQRLYQFAANIYGPAIAAGLAAWHSDRGNYWGHNAIIRTEAFAGAAGLPHLPGPPPFGGPIQSHDFVEAVLLQRAGWGVHMAPSLPGSYEGLPPRLADYIARDRRWAQGNLQHLSILTARGLAPMGRVHLAMGALSYLISAVWAASLGVGAVLALQSQQLLPSYFADSKTLFPIWPIIDPGAALRLFVATLAVVLLPKALGIVLELKRVRRMRERGGTLRVLAGGFIETIFSMLLAPILMLTQTFAVFEVFMGWDSGWKAQRRDGGPMTFKEAVRFHWRHTAVGTGFAVLCWQSSPALLFWTAPVILGLVLSIPLSWILARESGPVLSALLQIPEDRSPPPLLVRAEANTAYWTARFALASEDPRNPTSPLRDLPRAA